LSVNLATAVLKAM